MNEPAEMDLVEMFRAFLNHYPSMRFGQAICAVAGWDNDDPIAAADETLAAEIKENLESRFGDSAYDTASSSMPNQLAAVLRELRRRKPGVPLGKLLAPLVLQNNWNLYDVENDELIVALEVEIATRHETSAHDQPIPA